MILDVVYNHTGEGGHEGPTLAFRGLDHLGYYRLTHDRHNDYDVTGCGNSVDTSEPGVLRLVLDSLRYWVTEMGVDGFRFDLVSTLLRDEQHHVDQNHPFKRALRTDPVLSRVKIIAEPWDLGPYGYQLGTFGPGWSEWNDRFRNYVRDFWRGHTHGVAELAQRLSGSPDIYDRHGRAPTASINFVTAHDGFTLRDLVSYDVKHNDANGEHNRDGTDDNRSWNCGVEGETDDSHVNALRHRQAQNLMATLLLAAGVPMITAGDELGRTQQGNNNAYCQDSPISWVHWDTVGEWHDLTETSRRLLQLRADHPVLRRRAFRHGEFLLDPLGKPTGRRNIAWFGGRKTEMSREEWDDGTRKTLGMYLAEDDPARTSDEAYLIWFHAGAEPIQVDLPDGPWATTYTRGGPHRMGGGAAEREDRRRLGTAAAGTYGRGLAGGLGRHLVNRRTRVLVAALRRLPRPEQPSARYLAGARRELPRRLARLLLGPVGAEVAIRDITVPTTDTLLTARVYRPRSPVRTRCRW